VSLLTDVDWDDDTLGSAFQLGPCMRETALLLALVDSRRLITPGVEDLPFANIPFFVSGFIYHQLSLLMAIALSHYDGQFSSV
jgi:hypothetical protein